MHWGHQIEYLEGLRETMGIMPKALLNRPEQHELGGMHYAAFNTLSSSRQFGMGGALPISLEAMYAFCQMFAIDDLDDRMTFVSMIQRLDSAYMEESAKRIATSSSREVVNAEPAFDNSGKG